MTSRARSSRNASLASSGSVTDAATLQPREAASNAPAAQSASPTAAVTTMRRSDRSNGWAGISSIAIVLQPTGTETSAGSPRVITANGEALTARTVRPGWRRPAVGSWRRACAWRRRRGSPRWSAGWPGARPPAAT